MENKIIVVAGATGNLGERIVNALLERGAAVRALVRSTTEPAKLEKLKQRGVEVVQVNMANVPQVANACAGASCVVSALAGLHDVVIGTQKVLLDGAVAAGVPRFIPSDFSLDFTKLPAGRNRNLDLRREFHTYLDKAAISATTIFNGPFADLLTNEMPMVLFNHKRVLYWGDADQQMDFTTMDDTAAYTARVALDPSAPRFLRIAGDAVSARELAAVASAVYGSHFRLLRAGGLELLSLIIKVARVIAPGKDELYPAWQGMQYMRDMADGRAKLNQNDNGRYPDMQWTTIKDILAAHPISKK